MASQEIHPVDSKQHMLTPTDIFLVAAHEDKYGQKTIVEAAKKAHVSVERMLYSVMINMYSNKGLIRIREGNTLFTIAAFEGRVGVIQSYNGDVAKNYVENMRQLVIAARKLGFDFLVAFPHTPEMVKLLKLSAKRIKDPEVKTHFDKDETTFTLSTGKQRG